MQTQMGKKRNNSHDRRPAYKIKVAKKLFNKQQIKKIQTVHAQNVCIVSEGTPIHKEYQVNDIIL